MSRLGPSFPKKGRVFRDDDGRIRMHDACRLLASLMLQPHVKSSSAEDSPHERSTSAYHHTP